MNQVLILLSIVLVISVNSQMQSFDAILQCGKLVKKMVGNYNKVVHQSKNPQEVVSTIFDTLQQFPEVLSTCGKDNLASIYRNYLSHRCLHLLELEATFTLRKIQYRFESQKNKALIFLYTGLADLITQNKYKHCRLLNLNINQLSIMNGSRCMSDLVQTGKTIKDKLEGVNSNLSIVFDIIGYSMNQFWPLALTCKQQFYKQIPAQCFSEIKKLIDIVLTIQNYSSSVSWIWQNVRGIKNSIGNIQTQCSGLTFLF